MPVVSRNHRFAVSQRQRTLFAFTSALVLLTGLFGPSRSVFAHTSEEMRRTRMPYHVLSWEEFSINDRTEGMSALTQTFLSCQYEGKAIYGMPGQDGTPRCTATVSEIAFTGGFDAAHSWRRSSVQEDNDQLLRHEQGHLDINEIKLRELRSLPSSAFPIGIGETREAAMDDLKVKLAAFYRKHNEELQRLQERYDEETNHGRSKRQQNAWCEKLRNALSGTTIVTLSTLS